MDQATLALLSAQVHFLETEIALIHIPLHLYGAFLQPILQLIVPTNTGFATAVRSPGINGSAGACPSQRPWWQLEPFINISITPVECSIACSRTLANKLFVPVRDSLESTAREQIVISNEDYVVIQVDGGGFEAGRRVLELTSPLAMNGISIFFITTYFSDYILVPHQSRKSVVSALETRGFVFEAITSAFVSTSSPLINPYSRTSHKTSVSRDSLSDDNPFDTITLTTSTSASSLTELPHLQRPIGTPPPSSVSELESRTFELLKKRNISPTVDSSIQLVHCAGPRDASNEFDQGMLSARLQLGLLRCLVNCGDPNPSSSDHTESVSTNGNNKESCNQNTTTATKARFLSITLTSTESLSLLLERRLLSEFEDAKGEEVLLGSKEDNLIPIIFDLRDLPMESTGIVCGVAGRVVGAGGRTMEGGEEESTSSSPSSSSPSENDNKSCPIDIVSTSTSNMNVNMDSNINSNQNITMDQNQKPSNGKNLTINTKGNNIIDAPRKEDMYNTSQTPTPILISTSTPNKPQADAEAELESEAESESENEPPIKTKTKAQAQAQTKPSTKIKAQAQAHIKPSTKTKTKTRIKTEKRTRTRTETIEMTYLSTAKAGTVIVPESEFKKAMRVLM